ncbi:MAG: hypothetical protein AAFQ80_15010 [Cyanobacteria bacterium J06621_8]
MTYSRNIKCDPNSGKSICYGISDRLDQDIQAIAISKITHQKTYLK